VGARRIAGIERVVDQLRVPDRNVGIQAGVQRATQLVHRERLFQLEVDDLAEGVDAGIGSARRRESR